MRRRKKFETLSFTDLAKIIHAYLKEEGLSLNFSGYREILKRYFQIEDNNISEIYKLIIDCNLWSNYFAELESFMSFKKEQYILQAELLYAYKNPAKTSKCIEVKIQDNKKRIKHFDMFTKHCRAQKNFFKKASEHCNKLYFKGLNKF